MTVTKLLYTSREAAAILSVCTRTLFTLTARGDLPAVRIGRSVRYHLDDLREFIDAQRKGG
jgi:excisionase family DNA binding protein